jgi:hypothetical protein
MAGHRCTLNWLAVSLRNETSPASAGFFFSEELIMPGTISAGGNVEYAYMCLPILTPASVAANTTVEQAFVIPGLVFGDNVSCYSQNAPQTTGIGIINCRVSAANTLQLGFSNSTAGALSPVSGQYYLYISRPESYATLPTTAA